MGCFRAFLLLALLSASLPAAPPPRPPVESLSPQQREHEAERLRAVIRDLRWKLQREGEREARRGDAWWDLPHRRRQQQRLRHLRMLRQRLEDAQSRLWALEAADKAEKTLKDKP